MKTNYQIGSTILQVKGLGIEYNGKSIIENINFEIKNTIITDKTQGQVIAVVGRSGRGKSTLFRALAGMVEPTSGSIDIYTGDEALSPVREGLVGLVQQSYPLSRNQTVVEMLIQAASIGKISKKDQKSIVLEKLEEWGLSAQKDQSTNQLSGGQKQRVAILEQILCPKNFFIMDEPFSGLDVKNKRDAQQSIERITKMNEFNTVFFSTHEIEIAVELADHIIVIGYQNNQDGSVRTVGTVIEQYDLKAMGLAWKGFTPEHAELQKQIEQTLIKS